MIKIKMGKPVSLFFALSFALLFIGLACGTGMYVTASVATAMVLFGLEFIPQIGTTTVVLTFKRIKVLTNVIGLSVLRVTQSSKKLPSVFR